MDGSTASTYWCYKCNQQIDPIIEIEIKCPNCNDTFVEERERQQSNTVNNEGSPPPNNDFLLHMFTQGLRQRRRPNQEETQAEEEANNSAHDRASIVYHVIRNMEERLRLESNSSSDTNPSERRRVRHAIFISPSGGHAIIVGGLEGGDNGGRVGGTLGDYFVGPGLEDLIQQLAENDPSKYGTPPAEKLAVEAMPRVKVDEGGKGCPICLEEMEVGELVRMMPCKHLFHDGCILPWLEMHSSCPVCRHHMPAQEVKVDRGAERTNDSAAGGEGVGRRIMTMMMAPFGALFGQSAGDGSNRD